MNNFLPLNRDLMKHWLWKDKPFSKGQAWVDLLMLANYEDTKRLDKGKLIDCKRGDVNLSISSLADRWGWDRKKARRFLNVLESDNMVSVNGTTQRTTITIVNYEVFNNSCPTNDPKVDQRLDNERPADDQRLDSECPTNDQHMTTTNKDKEQEEIKEIKNNKNTTCKADALALFEQLWQLYPVKKGKGQVSLAAKQRLLKVGYGEMVRAIGRYKVGLEKDSDWRKPQNGSTFFNSGYLDYLDSNYDEGDGEYGRSGRNDAADEKRDGYAEEWDRLLGGE